MGEVGAVPRTDRTGIVLAGGFSTRFGECDKALATVAGEPMLARVVGRLGSVVDEVVVSCRRDQRPGFDRVLAERPDATVDRYAFDPAPDGGPLVGLLTALEAVETEAAAVVGCDMPWLSPGLFGTLFERVAAHEAAVPESADGHAHPLHAVYGADASRRAGRARRDAGRRSLCGLVERLDAVALPVADVPAGDGRCLRDVDVRTDLEAVESRSERPNASRR